MQYTESSPLGESLEKAFTTAVTTAMTADEPTQKIIDTLITALSEAAVSEKGVDMVGDIATMHSKFGVREVVETFDKEKLRKFLEFRLNFLQEELNEARSAFEDCKPENAEHVVDAMIDLCVVAIGTLDAFQVDTDLAWYRVWVANMMKKPGIKPERPNPLGLPDLIKPEGWTAPSHVDNVGLLAKAFE